ncbi:MAG: hypothetical protein AAGA43_13405 [Bacteroidota bacterium]
MLSARNPSSCVKKTTIFFVLFSFCIVWAFSQSVVPQLPKAATFKNYGGTLNPHQSALIGFSPSAATTINQSKHSQQMAVYEDDARRLAKEEEMRKMAIKDAEAYLANSTKPALPTFRNQKGTQHYRNAYVQLLSMVGGPFSTRKATFVIENAYYEGEKDYSEFEQTIKQTGDFLRQKMEELDLDQESNLAKNYLLFQFFADTLEIKSKGLKHFPYSYDFEDYWGKEDWSKMFVHKLLLTGKGQCSSLPKLYLILAEEIGAKAHLALSPNHSYIKFPDDEGRWHNIELTNNMLSTDAFILNSGYVKSEAIQNKIFMHPFNDTELLSNHFDQLALGYIRKYGYDEFVAEVLETAIELNPNNITAHLSKANLQALTLKYATEQLGITKNNFNEIRKYPELVKLYRSVVGQYDYIDNLGYAEMPQELYEKWLSSVNEQEEEQINKSFNINPIKQKKN